MVIEKDIVIFRGVLKRFEIFFGKSGKDCYLLRKIFFVVREQNIFAKSKSISVCVNDYEHTSS